MADTSEALKDIFDEVFMLLEDLETRNVAVLEYLREQGGVTDEKLAPYLDRAGAASNVKWRAARVRMEYLLAPAPKSTTEHEKSEKRGGTQVQAKEQPKSKDAQGTHSNAEQERSTQKKSDGDQNAEEQAGSLAEPVHHLEAKESKDAESGSNAKQNSKSEENSNDAKQQAPKRSEKTASEKEVAPPTSSKDKQATSDTKTSDVKADSASKPELSEAKSPKTHNDEGNDKTQERSTSASSH